MPKKTDNLISQVKFAEICGISRQSISKAIQRGLIGTASRKGVKKVNLDDHFTKLYQEKRKVSTKSFVAQQRSKKGEFLPKNNGGASELLSLQETKTAEEIKRIKAERRLKELKFKVERGKLIDKETVASILFGYLEALNLKMLDYPEMIIDTMIDKVKAGTTRGKLVSIMRAQVSKEIKLVKKQLTARITDL